MTMFYILYEEIKHIGKDIMIDNFSSYLSLYQ